MDIERYRSLAEAYGADMSRWPQDQRDPALALHAREPEAAGRILAEAAFLDEALDAWRPPTVSHALRERVLAGAPRPRAALGGRSLGGRFGLWLSGAGLAAACAAGIVVGMAGSSAAISDVRADEMLAAAASEDASTALAPFTVSDRLTLRREA
ncbi:MAG: hypothetical protein B7Y99_09615 [Caulobacterales bacterium 32-69-10]|nr:MAG: hypothetical protein B7Y99_09615 [Caulobacterales bacterium 32-69-10]